MPATASPRPPVFEKGATSLETRTIFICANPGSGRHGVLQRGLVQYPARTVDDRALRIFRADHRQAGPVPQRAVEPAELRAAPGEHHAVVDDVRAELGWGVLDGGADRVADR